MNQNNIPKGQLSTIILSTLLQGDKYGYEIINEIKNKTDGELVIKQPSLYSSLTRMEKQNLISSYWGKSDIGGKRHYYSITDFGKKQFEKMETSFYTSQEKVSNCLENKSDKNKHSKKYDVIGDISKTDEQIPVFKNENPLKNQIELEKEINLLQPTSTSFAENSIIAKPQISPACILEKLEEETISIPNLETTRSIGISDILSEEFKNQKPKNMEEQEPIEELGNYSQNVLEEKNKTDEPLKDDGVFIEEKYEPENVPKVKKLNILNINNNENVEISRKLDSNHIESGYTEKINALYNKTKNINEKNFNNDKTKTSTYNELQDYYNKMNIKLSIHNQKVENLSQPTNTLTYNKIFKKYLIILLLVVAETALSFFAFTLLNLNVNYIFLYFLVPALFCILPIYYYLKIGKGDSPSGIKSNSLVYNLLIFIVGLVLLYSLNMLIGMNYLTISSYATTYIYPSILMTNALIGGLLDIKILNKK